MLEASAPTVPNRHDDLLLDLFPSLSRNPPTADCASLPSLQAILRQDQAWFDQTRANQLSTRIAVHSSSRHRRRLACAVKGSLSPCATAGGRAALDGGDPAHGQGNLVCHDAHRRPHVRLRSGRARLLRAPACLRVVLTAACNVTFCRAGSLLSSSSPRCPSSECYPPPNRFLIHPPTAFLAPHSTPSRASPHPAASDAWLRGRRCGAMLVWCSKR